MNTVYDVIIIGGGAAGLMCAISAASRQKSVLILEKNNRLGLKILISGGGRCNFTNLNISSDDYVSLNKHFCKSALKQYTQNDFIEFIKKGKIPYYEKTLGQLFCKKSSKDILNYLQKQLHEKHVEVLTSQNIKDVNKVSDQFLVQSNQKTYKSHNLVIATGGLSYPKLGASDLGYKIAKKFGHEVTALSPSLDGIVFSKKEKDFFYGLQGISLQVTITCNKRSFNENILFTHVGLSGPAILKASLFWSDQDKMHIDFLPQVKDFMTWLKNQRKQHPKKLIVNTLSELLPQKLCEKVVQNFNIDKKNISDLSKNEMLVLQSFLKNFECIPQSTVGYHKAEVTRGGIKTNNISSQNLQSKLVSQLFFVGEVVDVTGLLGGYNFQWAWSSGWVVGQNI